MGAFDLAALLRTLAQMDALRWVGPEVISPESTGERLRDAAEPREGMLAFMEKRPPSWVPEGFWLEGGRTR